MRRIVSALLLCVFLPISTGHAAPAASGDFFGIKMVSESRAAHFTPDGFARGELPDDMDKRVYGKADFSGGILTFEVFNGLTVPLNTEYYRAVSVRTFDGKFYDYEMKLSGGFGKEIAPGEHKRLRISGEKFKGKKEDIKMIILAFNLGGVKVVLLPAGGANWTSLTARVSEPAAPAVEPSAPATAKTEPAFFKVHEVKFEGNKVVSTADLNRLAAPFLDREINFMNLQDLVSTLKTHYRSKGWATAYVYLPKQSLSSGTLRIGVMEGELASIDVEGNKHVSDTAVKKYFPEARPGQLMKYGALEKDLVRLNNNPDIKATAVLVPGPKQGTTDLKIKVKDKNPQHLTVDANNLGAEGTGRYRVGGTYTNNNLLGNTDSLTLRGQGGRDAGAFSVDYNVPAHFIGGRVGGGYTHAYNEVGSGDFRDLGIGGDVDLFSGYLLRPFVAKQDFQATGRLGFDWKSAENEILDQVSGKDELRVLNAGVNFEKSDASGTTYSPHVLYVGLDMLGASTESDPITARGADGEFLIYRGSLVRQQRLNEGTWLYLRGTTQLTPDILPPVEQMPLGGAYSVRGHSQSAFLADSGASATAELRFEALIPPSWKMPFTGESMRKSVQWVAFVDAGTAMKADGAFQADRESATLYGAGGGLRLHLFDRFFARFEWAQPMANSGLDGEDGIISYFGVSAELI